MLWTGFIKKDRTIGGNVTKMARGQKLKLTDIICRIITTDGEVDLNERIWMNKLCESNDEAKEMAGAMLCPDFYDPDGIDTAFS